MGTVLETPRIRLREFLPEDTLFVVELLMNATVMRYWPRPYTQEEASDWVARMKSRNATDGFAYWLAELRSSQQAIGVAGVLTQQLEDAAVVGLGYILSPEHWNMGLATEAAKHCLDWANDRGHYPVCALIRPNNEPSIKVAKRIGLCESRRVPYHGLEHIVFSQS